MRAGIPSALAALITGVSASAFVVLGVAIPSWGGENAIFLLALGTLVVASETVDFSPLPNSRESVSIGAICAAGILGGVCEAAIVALTVAAADQVLHQVALHKAIYNGAVLVMSGAAFVGTVDLLGNDPQGGVLEALPAVAVASVAAFSVNASLLAMAISLETGRRIWSICAGDLGWMLPHYVALGGIGWLMAVTYGRWDLVGLFLLLVPLSLEWLVIRCYTDRNSGISSLRQVPTQR